jgi:hypothetical protein
VTKPLIAILVSLAVLTVWGAIAPRGQWRVLAGWTRRNPYASEPGPISVGVHRFVSILATLGLGFGGVLLWQQYERSLPQPPPPLSRVQQMWGAPDPVVLDRVIDSVSSVPSDLVAQPVLRYQLVDNSRRAPNYLFDLHDWKLTGPLAVGGILGAEPSAGLSALDTAAVVVQVRGDKNCIPRAVYATEDSTTVIIAVFYGRPDTASGTAPVALNDCKPVTKDSDSTSVLIPIRLQEDIGKRAVRNFNGTPIPSAPLLLR